MSIQVKLDNLKSSDPEVVVAILTNRTCWWEFQNEQRTWTKRSLGTWTEARRSAKLSYSGIYDTSYGIIEVTDYELVK